MLGDDVLASTKRTVAIISSDSRGGHGGKGKGKGVDIIKKPSRSGMRGS